MGYGDARHCCMMDWDLLELIFFFGGVGFAF